MEQSKTRLLIATTLIGATIGLAAGLALSESKRTQLPEGGRGERMQLASPGIRDWIGIVMAVVGLIRQITNLFTPEA